MTYTVHEMDNVENDVHRVTNTILETSACTPYLDPRKETNNHAVKLL